MARHRIMLFTGTTLAEAWPHSHAVEFIVWLRHDAGPLLPAWPADLIADLSEAIRRWREINDGRRLVAMTSACVPDEDNNGFRATVVLHHVAAASPGGEDDGGTNQE